MSLQYPEYAYTTFEEAVINLDNAIPLLSSFCQSVVECQHYGLEPDFRITVHPSVLNPVFQCDLYLPSVFEMEPLTNLGTFRTKTVAKAVAAWKAFVGLYEKGWVDDDLNPVKRDEHRLVAYEGYKANVMTSMPDRALIPSPTYRHLGLSPVIVPDRQPLLYLHRLIGFDRVALMAPQPLPPLADEDLLLKSDPPVPVTVGNDDLERLRWFHGAMSHLAMYGDKILDDSSPYHHFPLDDARDKGYIMVPLALGDGGLDWDLIRKTAGAKSLMGHASLWPSPLLQGGPPQDSGEVLVVWTHHIGNQKSRLYEVYGVSDLTLGTKYELMKEEGEAKRKAKAARLAEDISGETKNEEGGGDGRNLRPHPDGREECWAGADWSQVLLVGRKLVIFGHHIFEVRASWLWPTSTSV